jgi:hypothetical protein
MQQGNSNIIERLFSSFGDLEKAISSAKDTLAKKESVSPDIIERLNSYDGILEKQRRLAEELCTHITNGDWDKVTQQVSIINGLSAMIRDDARAILSSLHVNSDEQTDGPVNYC